MPLRSVVRISEANVVFPAPLGPAMRMRVGTFQISISPSKTKSAGPVRVTF
jgi:hypothetical protein